jgi:hypothetical protein
MELKDIVGFRLKRESPFEGLIVDSDTWQDAHTYHRDQQRLHVLAFHGTGIVGGLEVTANDPADLSVTVQPGMGVDPLGNSIVVSQAHRHQLKTKEAGTVYLVMQFREVPEGPYQPPEGGQPTRILEAYRIQETDKLPKEPHIELARIDFDPSDSSVKKAKNAARPGKNEIDTRHRRSAFPPATEAAAPPPPPPPPPEPVEEKPAPAVLQAPVVEKENITVLHAVLGEADKNLHVLGLQNLAREINLMYNLAVHLELNGSIDKEITGCNLVYLTGSGGFELTQKQQDVLGHFLESGGTVIADGCADGDGEGAARAAKEFGLAFNQLAGKLERKLENVQRGHPLLSAGHVFAQVPEGAQQGMILEGGKMIYSSGDYGCAWEGGYQGTPLSRETIRAAVEMAANIIAYSRA